MRSPLSVTATYLALLLVAWLVTGAACDSTDDSSTSTTGSTQTVTSGGTSTATLPEPAEHRPEPLTCTGEPPPGNAIPDDTGACQVDAECTEGDNGRCIWPFGGSNVCVYDECFVDGDCGGASVCACRVDANFGLNRCFQGACVVDAECGAGGYCSPSGVGIFPNCMTGVSPGSIGFFCHGADDECTDDDDCAGEDAGVCLFSVEAMRWNCQPLLCTN